MTALTSVAQAQSLLDSGRPDDALHLAGTHLAGHPDDVDALVVLAIALLELKRFPEAVEQAVRAVSLEPSRVEAIQVIAFARLAMRQFEDALDCARECVRLQPENWAVWVNLSTIARAPDRLSKEAFHAAIHAIELEPNLPATHRSMGNLWFNRREWRAAAWEYRMALRIDPLDTESQRLLNLVVRETGNFTESAREFARLAAQEPGDASHDHNLRVTLSDLLFRSMGGVVLALMLETTSTIFILQEGFPFWATPLIMFGIAIITVGLVALSLRRSAAQLGSKLAPMLEYLRRRDDKLLIWAVIQGLALIPLLIAPFFPFPANLLVLAVSAFLLLVAWAIWVMRSFQGGR